MVGRSLSGHPQGGWGGARTVCMAYHKSVDRVIHLHDMGHKEGTRKDQEASNDTPHSCCPAFSLDLFRIYIS